MNKLHCDRVAAAVECVIARHLEGKGTSVIEIAKELGVSARSANEALGLGRAGGVLYAERTTPGGANAWFPTVDAVEHYEETLELPVTHTHKAVGAWQLDHPVPPASIFALACQARV
jgi:transposase